MNSSTTRVRSLFERSGLAMRPFGTVKPFATLSRRWCRADSLGLRQGRKRGPVRIGLNPIHTSKGCSFWLLLLTLLSEQPDRVAPDSSTTWRTSRVWTALGTFQLVAHELHHPLTAILSNAQAAQRFLACDDVDLMNTPRSQ